MTDILTALGTRGDCVHERFEAQVERTPTSIALEYGDRRLTYSELNETANRLARELVDRGVGPERIVALFFDRSPETLIASLAVLKAGGAYLPLDPRYPELRIADMLDDVPVAQVLSTTALAPSLPAVAAEAIALDAVGGPWRLRAGHDLAHRARPDNLAYVIYTSGSTGRPRGVAVSHRGLCALAADQIAQWGCGPGSRVLQFASLSFDASFTEIAVALLSGATLCLAPADSLMPGDELARTLRRLRISAVKAPPSALAVTPADDLDDLQLVVSGGGACTAAVVRRWSQGRVFRNAYGTTECSVCSTFSAPLAVGDVISLGPPIAGTRLHVLDSDLRPVPAGGTGELFLAGAGVARGYAGRPGVTAERFLPCPAAEPGSRMYRTGDRVRRTSDGVIEYVGRADHQVKVRGYRVEPGEVETALLAHPAVREVAVVARRAHPDEEARLVAHVVLDESARCDVAELRAHVAERLPEHMVPQAFVVRAWMPLTLNRKIDRDALEGPEGSRPDGIGPYAQARTTSERAVARIWSQVLDIREVGIHDNFFDLGGDSLLASRTLLLIREIVGADVPLRRLLLGPTVAEVAVAVEERMPDGPAEPSPHP